MSITNEQSFKLLPECLQEFIIDQNNQTLTKPPEIDMKKIIAEKIKQLQKQRNSK